MKTLESVNVSRLTNLEFGQHVKSVLKNVNLLGGGTLISDAVLVTYLARIETLSAKYDKAMVQVAKSDETAKIDAADKVRDIALSALSRYLNVFELSDVPDEVLAYTSLKTLLDTYGNLQAMNYEEESNGIVNLIVDLGNAKYSAHAALLNLGGFVNRLEAANVAFEALFDGRTQETASKEVYDVKELRTHLKQAYNDMIDYVLSMAKAKDTAEFNDTLTVINTVRKYYYVLLAKRKPAKKGETPEPIPPMKE